MTRRRQVQQQHERAVVANFLAWLNRRRGTRFRVIEEPNPPEAIIRSPRKTSWVEVVDAFWTASYAQDLFSYATPGEPHRPITPGPYVNVDDPFSRNLVAAIANKIAKSSYLPFLERHGPGYLVVSIHYPLFDTQTLRAAQRLWAEGRPWRNMGCFCDIYLEDRMLGSPPFRRWRM